MAYFSVATLLDLVIAMMILEGVVVAFIRVSRRSGPESIAFAANLGAGLFLVLAARLAVVPAATLAPVGMCLLGALCAHLIDLRARWPR